MHRRHVILGILAVAVAGGFLTRDLWRGTAGDPTDASRHDDTNQPAPGLKARGPGQGKGKGKGEAQGQDPTDAEDEALEENEYRISGRILDAEGRPAMGEAFITDGDATESMDFIMEDGLFASTQSWWGVYRILVILEAMCRGSRPGGVRRAASTCAWATFA